MPKIGNPYSKFKKRISRYATKRNITLTAGLALVLAGGWLGLNIITKDGTAEIPQVAGSGSSEKADFKPLIPINQKEPQRTVSTGLCSNDTRLICYEDKYLNGQLKVTQQKLKDGQKIDSSKLLEIAKASFQQTSALDYAEIQAKNGKAVIVSYKEIAAQRAVYVSNDMLVFITTEKSYVNAQWKEYFDSLRLAP